MKLILVCGLALAMTVPAFFVSMLVGERALRASTVERDISEHAGGPQTFLGPTLAIPYRLAPDLPAQHVYLVFPAQASGIVKTSTEERRRSLFRVPVYRAELNLDAQFDLTGVPSALPSGAELDWTRAEVIVGVSDPRGATSDATISVNATNSAAMTPADIAQTLPIGGNAAHPVNLTLLGSRSGSYASPNSKFAVRATLRFSGAQRLAMLAYGKSTEITMQGDWPSPGFDGSFLPGKRSVSASGFRADWSVPFIARRVRAEGPLDSFAAMDAAAFGVSFVEMASAYQSVSRSVKYALLFVGLVFLSYFAFEATTGRKLHPGQYVLVGIAQIIFYLLLLSIAERIGFDLAFLLAGSATVMLLSVNAAWVFASRIQGVRGMALFSMLYSAIYVLLRLEDNALLVGALASFAAISAVMYLTRGIDWYAATASVPGGQDGH